MRSVLAIAGWILCLTALGGARQDRETVPPQFRSGVELIQLDVSVLDRDRRPVRGLTPGDFTVFMDGQPRPISAFKYVEVAPPGPPPGALWMNDVAPDVVTNTRPNGRIVTIVIDDGSINTPNVADLFAVRKTRDLARATVDELAANDLAAVIFTENSHQSQNFTRDRRLLLDAIDKAPLVPSPTVDLAFYQDMATTGLVTTEAADPFGINRPSCDCGACSIETLGRVADGFLALQGQRKIVVFISAGVLVDPQISVPYSAEGSGYAFRTEYCNVRRQRAMADVYRRAGLANVTIEAIDVRGMPVGGGLPASERAPSRPALAGPSTSGGIDMRVEFLRGLAEQTGGRAVVRNNEAEREVRPLVEESSFYYLIGVEAPIVDDGRLHAIKVNVTRPGVEVRTRRGYMSPTADERRRMQMAAVASVESAMTGLMPKADIPLELNVLPVPDPRAPEGASLAVITGITRHNDTPGVARTERFRVVATAFHPESGQSVGSHEQVLDLRWTASDAGTGRFEVLSRLPLTPGRYEVRVGVEASDRQTGSVYGYADIPDFRKDGLTLSGLVLNTTPAPRVATGDAFSDVIPFAPTARRTFRRTDQVAIWLRLHRPKDAPGTVTTRLTNDENEVIAELTQVIETPAGGDARTADHRIDLPIDDLVPGEYLVTVEVSAGVERARRDVRFHVQ